MRIKPTGKMKRTKGAQFPGAKTVEYGKALLAIGRKLKNRVKPEDIVAAAASSRSPLHSFIFAIDDTTAATSHRLTLARHLTTHIEVEYLYPDGSVCFHPVFYNVRVTMAPSGNSSMFPPAKQYVSVARVSSKKDIRRELIKEEIKTIQAAVQRLRSLISMESRNKLKVAAIDTFEGSLKTLSKAIQ